MNSRMRVVWIGLPIVAAAALVAGLLASGDEVGGRGSTEQSPETLDESRQAPTVSAVAPVCGDGRLGPGEECDPPGDTIRCDALVSSASAEVATCNADCLWDYDSCLSRDAVCGDGVVEGGELCDDGNRRNGDGCDSSCWVELDGTSVLYDGPAVDVRVERAIGASPCRDRDVRRAETSAGRRRVEVRLLICRLPNGEDVYPVERIRSALAEAGRWLRPAGIELVEDGMEQLDFAPGCRVPYGAPALRDLAAETRARHKLPLFFVESISGGPVPGGSPQGFAAFGYGAVLASTEPDVLIHELGHVFGLLHTHACLDGSVGPEARCDRQGDGICDTPYDPGPAWLPHRCGGRPAESCPLECDDTACSLGSVPDRSNLMSYYSGCRAHLSTDQLDLMRCVLDHDLAWLRAGDGCGTEICNGVDDDCDGQTDEGHVCTPECVIAESLSLGRTVGTTVGRGEKYGGELYPEGTPDVLYELRPDRRGAYCISIGAGRSNRGETQPPIVAQRDGCTWNAPIVASNLDGGSIRSDSTLEVTAGPESPAWISVDGWGRSPGVAYSLDVVEGSCEAARSLESPRLLEPASGARVTTEPIELRWEPVESAEAYELRLSGDREGLTDEPPCELCDAEIVYAPAVSLPGVRTGSRIAWTVRALRGDESSPFAPPRSFVVGRRPGEHPPTAPRLVNPEPDALLPTLTETFQWQPVDDALFYQLRIGLDARTIDSESCDQCASFTTAETSYQPSPRIMAPDTEYFWTVRAANESGVSAYASARRFEIEDWICTRVGRLEVPGEQSMRTVDDGYDDLTSSCGGDSNGEHVWLIVQSETGPLCIDTDGSAFDTVLSVRRRCEQPETEIACNDDGFGEPGGASRLQVDGIADEPLFVIVDGFDVADTGAYSLHVAQGACP